ncbi:hypothetical protein BDN67DRAFT_881197, partial [Paxillus ammoniavirescens]
SPFATLPLELILLVISFATGHYPTVRALSLVSSWVHKHVEPALYHTVRLRSSRALASFISALHNKPHTFAAQTVKKLCITALGPISSIETVLSRCTGVTSLACGFSAPSYVHCARGVLPYLPITPKEQHLLPFACRDGLDMTIISPSVTHLRIQLTPSMTSKSVARLSELRQLTHLAVLYKHGQFGLGAIKGMLRPVIQGEKLRVLVLQIVGTRDYYSEEIRKWNESKEVRRKAQRTVEGQTRPGLIITVERAPRSILSQWE